MEGLLSKIVQLGVRKGPTVLGGGILGVALIGLFFGVIGISLGLVGEGLSAIVGMAVASRFA